MDFKSETPKNKKAKHVKAGNKKAAMAPWMDTMNLFDDENELPEGDEVFYHSKA